MSRRHERAQELLRDEVYLRPRKRSGSFRIALCYPNLYFVGMSNLGFQGVYALFNESPDVLCERAFLPDDREKEELVSSNQRLTSLESGTPLGSFDALAFSVSFENDYVHVLQMLHLAGIPLRAEDRGPSDPLVILGGSALFLNPEPLSSFADVIAVGEGEALVPKLLEGLLGSPSPREGIPSLLEKDGFYVPSRHEVSYHPDGTVAAYHGPGPAVRQRGWPGKMALPESVILTPHTRRCP